jgi:hypothetical protein
VLLTLELARRTSGYIIPALAGLLALAVFFSGFLYRPLKPIIRGIFFLSAAALFGPYSLIFNFMGASVLAGTIFMLRNKVKGPRP